MQELMKESIAFFMPEEYKGETTMNGGMMINRGRKWTTEEIDWMLMLKEKGLSISQIAECIDRNKVQVTIKIQRLGKKDQTYNYKHKIDKYETNDLFLKDHKYKSVLDVYAGADSYYLKQDFDKVVTNDINKSFNTDYHMDALSFCCMQYAAGSKYDLIDLDPFGSAYDCFDLAIKMAKKGLIITLGELGHVKFKRLDFVRRHYGIDQMNDFTTQNLIEHIMIIGERNKKKLTPVFIKDWRNIARVYFEIDRYKITEQWNSNK